MPRRRYTVLLYVVCSVLGPVLAAWLGLFIHRLQTETIRARHEADVNDFAREFERELSANFEVLYGLRAFFDASTEVSPQTFAVVAQQARARHRAVQALEWVPRVNQDERAAHEAAGEPAGEYRIKHRESQGVMVPAPQQAEYFPVYYVVPREGNELAVGFDLASNEARRAALARSRRTGQLVATEPITLVQEGAQSKGFLVLLPVYEGEPNTDGARWARCRGFVLGVFRVDDLMAELLDARGPERLFAGLSLVQGEDFDDESRVLYRVEPAGDEVARFGHAVTLKVAGLSWRVAATPRASAMARQRDLLPWVSFVVLSVFITALLVMMVLLVRRQRALVEARDLATLSDRVTRQFFTMMSHELRTPLGGITGTVEMLQLEHLGPRQRTQAATIKELASVLLAKIDDVLDYIGIEAGPLDLRTEALSMAEVVEAAFEGLAPQAREVGLKLDLDVADDVPALLRGDKRRIYQVMLRLLDNAIKFTERGRVRVRVRVHRAEGEQVEIEVEVADNGPGIEARHHREIFEPFFVVDASDSRKHAGAGMGLAICRRLVVALGGEIGVSSEIQQGSRFWFRVPLSLAGEEGDRSSGPAEHAPKGEALGWRPKILVVEDDAIHRRIVVRILETLGYPTVQATNGQEAVEAVERERPDCVLMDCQMPVMDGFAATERIRKLPPPLGDVPVIAVTAHTSPGGKERARGVGMNEFVIKPLPAEALVRLIAAQVPGAPAEFEGFGGGRGEE